MPAVKNVGAARRGKYQLSEDEEASKGSCCNAPMIKVEICIRKALLL